MSAENPEINVNQIAWLWNLYGSEKMHANFTNHFKKTICNTLLM
jgi:hypothetical protein